MFSDVYGTARARPLSRVAAPVAQRARARRHRQFFGLTGVKPGMRVLDIGCGNLGLRAYEPGLDITGLDVDPHPSYPGPFVRADATQPLPFGDGTFDLAYCTSVVEHLPADRRTAFAAELRRVARGYYVQTPAYEFPIEPHALLPFAHWLPRAARRRYWRLGAAPWEDDLALLRRREMEALFGPPHAEKFGPLVKSWVSISRVT